MGRNLLMGMLAFVLSSCNYHERIGPPLDLGTEGIWYKTISEEIFGPHCVQCHNAEKAKGGVVITNVQELIDNSWIVPGDPDNSQLYTLVKDGDMPLGPTKVPAEQVEMLRKWIENGMPMTAPAKGQTP
ncbi:hypothetical protein K2X33_01675 [bacterium]|nr:hypothetical protein [bacterium]